MQLFNRRRGAPVLLAGVGASGVVKSSYPALQARVDKQQGLLLQEQLSQQQHGQPAGGTGAAGAAADMKADVKVEPH